MSPWFAIALGTGAVIGLVYFGYPLVETASTKAISNYLLFLSETFEKMFKPKELSFLRWIILGSTLGLGLLGALLVFGDALLMLFFGLLFGSIGWFLPKVIVQAQWRHRIRKFDSQLTDTLDLMANSIKSGLNLSQVIQVLVQEMPDPVAQEFGMVLSHQKIGLTLDEALERLVKRVPSQDLAVAINSILILRETGGDLSETFEVISTTIRERRKVEGKISAITQQGKTSALILYLIPFGLGLSVYVVNPDYMAPLFSTGTGFLLIGAMLILQILGGLWLLKILKIEV